MKFIKQLDEMDCGPTCLKMICDHYGKYIPLNRIRQLCQISRTGTSLKSISTAGEELGYRTVAARLRFENENKPSLLNFPLPCIAFWNQKHFVVIYKLERNFVWIADPAYGKIKLSKEQFEKSWLSDGDKGIVLGLEPTPLFYEVTIGSETKSNSWNFLLQYLRPFKKLIIQFIIGILIGLILQVAFPFLSQSLIDVGVQNHNINFVWLILIAQFILLTSQTFVQFIQSWILLQIGKRINVNLISDFLSRLMKLPLGYFDSKNVGDLVQRINDNYRIEQFLTGSILSIFFSLLTLIVFSIILFVFDIQIFSIFAAFSLLYVIWIFLFMKQREKYDYLMFQQASSTQHTLQEMIYGMQEIKLQGSERKRRWKWLDIQAILFRIQSKSLTLRQYQDFGALFLNRLKDIIISFLAAKSVINGHITLGTMFAIQYIVGQLNAPFEQLTQFVRSAQDAKLSLNRMSEVTTIEAEEDLSTQSNNLPQSADIKLEKLSFNYPGSSSILSDIDLIIPHGKITAIVGYSGSGKTTLLKLLLGFYKLSAGKIFIGTSILEGMNKSFWRSKCGTVMQDGYIFSDSIAANIAESDDIIDIKKLETALHIANISEFVYSLPLTYNTIVGAKGMGLSQGQRQRLLIARAVYKNPDFLFFDEATNALDATTEKTIMENLVEFYLNKTVIIVAHRLSTVKNADQIIVLNKGEISEIGNHHSLLAKKGIYFHLVKNQLEMQ